MAPGGCLACGSASGASSPRGTPGPRGKRLPKRLGKHELEELSERTKLTSKEVRALYSRFRRLAPTGSLSKEQFRSTMGVLGLMDDTFLPDRMFAVFDADSDNQLSFEEFATSLAIMIRGTEEQKLKLSFDMTAGQRDAAGIALEDFQALINACRAMMDSLIAPKGDGSMGDEDVERLFNDLSSDERMPEPDSPTDNGGEESPSRAVITLDAYKAAAQGDEAFLQCLGLRPNTSAAGKKSPSGTGAKLRSTSREGGPFPSPGASPAQGHAGCGASLTVGGGALQSGQHVVSQVQLDELRERVARVNALLLKTPGGRPLGRCTNSSPSRSPSPQGNSEDEDERWWHPLPKKPPSSREASAVDEVCAELDNLLGWCITAESQDGTLKEHGGTSMPAGPFPRPAAKDVSRDSSRVGDQYVGVRKTNVPNTCGVPGSRNTIGEVDPTASDAHKPGSSRAGKQRRGKRHRLLGPKKGLAVHFGHENWNMVLSMMIGIRMAVGRSKHEIARDLQPVDFYMKEKFSIIPRIANIFDSAVSKRVQITRFIDYAPMVFQKIRTSFGIQHDDYIRSVGPEQLLGNMVLGNLSSLSELSSEGKSGAFFYHTADGNYMLKTVALKEYQLLRRMLKEYYDHIFSNAGTLLVRFLGLHCLSIRKNRKIGCGKKISKMYFVVMANMFNTPFDIHRRYDLKGSWIGRSTPPEKQDPGVALKDVDFNEANECIRVGEERKTIIMQQIERDSEFLAKNNIIDYSILLGIHEMGASGALDDAADDLTRSSFGPAFGPASGAGRLASTFEREPSSEAYPSNMRSSESSSMPARRYSGTGIAPTSGGYGAPRTSFTQPIVEVPLHRRDAGGMLSQDKRSLYLFGIIDILTPYDTFKRVEHTLKGFRHDPQGVSCCPPSMYASRFNNFIRRSFD